MANGTRFNKPEVEIRVRPNRRGEQRRPLVPWWMRLEKRHLNANRAQVRSKRGQHARTQTGAYQRRSVVKVMYTRNGKPRSNALAAHARYLTREGAQLENGRGVGFDAGRDDIDMVALVRAWEKSDDERMWRIIVSPEDADRMNLKHHIRDLIKAMEGDLGTRLEWVAIDHNNTENPHAHLLVRGIDQRGKALLIDPDYVRNGIRARSQEIASRELGQRLESEMLRARGETIDKERWTEIDRALQRRMNGDRVADYQGLVPYNDVTRVRAKQEIQRLQFLEGLGLARKIGSLSWELSADHERGLRARQRAMDVVKRQAEANKVRSLDELADERDVVMASSATRGGYVGRFVGYFEDTQARRYAGLQRGNAVTAIPTDRRDLRASQEYIARPHGQEWQIREDRERTRGRDKGKGDG
jgi:type IV secretory pathway VirD2 relaxase